MPLKVIPREIGHLGINQLKIPLGELDEGKKVDKIIAMNVLMRSNVAMQDNSLPLRPTILYRIL
jgi:hypothetical protein